MLHWPALGLSSYQTKVHATLFLIGNEFFSSSSLLFLRCSMPRLVFPSVQENSSAMAVLPQFLSVCGRKIDATTPVVDRCFRRIMQCHANI